jgi:hypothetical protein
MSVMELIALLTVAVALTGLFGAVHVCLQLTLDEDEPSTGVERSRRSMLLQSRH